MGRVYARKTYLGDRYGSLVVMEYAGQNMVLVECDVCEVAEIRNSQRLRDHLSPRCNYCHRNLRKQIMLQRAEKKREYQQSKEFRASRTYPGLGKANISNIAKNAGISHQAAHYRYHAGIDHNLSGEALVEFIARPKGTFLGTTRWSHKTTEIPGLGKLNLSAMARGYGLKRQTLHARIKAMGWLDRLLSPEEIVKFLTRPRDPRGRQCRTKPQAT